MIKIVSWNTGFARQPRFDLLEMDVDVALLQETCTPPPDVLDSIELSPYKPWLGESYTATALRPPRVVKLSNRVEVEWYEQVEPHRGKLGPRQMPASGIGLWDAATITAVDGGEPFNVVSMYAAWQRSHPNVGSRSLYPDASAHRIISDLTVLVPSYSGDGPEHRIIAAGDLNVCFGDSSTFTSRAQTIIDRLAVLGLEYVGPRYPDGRKADPLPENLTEGSLDVPTYHTATKKPETAELQLDHVFTSRALTKDVTTRAMNHVEQWGSSDHCRIIINVETTPKGNDPSLVCKTCKGLWTFRPVRQPRTNSMRESDFKDDLRSLKRSDGSQRFQENTVRNRISNCKNVERYEGDLDDHFDNDQCRDLLERLSYSTANQDTNNHPKHRVPIDGDIRTGSSTLKSAVKLYAEFRQRQFSNAHRP